MIEKIKNCCIARSKKVNEVIGKLNPLLNIEVVVDPFADNPSVQYSDNNVLLTLTEGEGEGLPEGYVEELFTVVLPENQVGQRYFLTKEY
jgi:hypothetical protein